MYRPLVEVSDKEICWQRIAKWYQECLVKSYYFYNESEKKPRPLKELMNELDGLVYLTDDFIEDNYAAPIKSCGQNGLGIS